MPETAPVATTETRPAAGRLWARGFGVVLRRSTPEAALAACPSIEQALRDGIARRYEGLLPTIAADADCFLVRADGEPAGLLTVERGRPEAGAATLGVVIAPEQRGRSLGIRAIFAAERRLRREGVRGFYALAPRTNGHGLYFWLRVGYVPLRGVDRGDGATWFQLARRRRRASKRPRSS